MDTTIIETNQFSVKQIELTEEQANLAMEIEQLNLICYQFRISDSDISRWARTINKLKPDLTPEILKEIILTFVLGNADFDRNIGIANIFRGYTRWILKKQGI